MTATHRPLSDWVRRADSRSSINDGNERADARTLPTFAQGWIRRIHTSAGVRALALHHPASGETVVELDDFGNPLEIDDAGVELVGRIEESWPDGRLDADDTAVLESLSREIRYFLLNRLAAEGEPSPGLFHALPWAPVREMAVAVTELVQGNRNPDGARLGGLGHWVTPAVTGVAGPLGQLYEGLMSGEPLVAVKGATALCAGLLNADTARIPARVRENLAAAAEAASSTTPFLRHSAKVAAQRLRGSSTEAFAIELSSELPLAATQDQFRVETRTVEDEEHDVTVEVTGGGRLVITVSFEIARSEDRDRLVASYGEVLVPVRVQAAETHGYWVALEARSGWMSGLVDVPVPQGDFKVTADEPAVGAWALATIDPAVLAVSVTQTHHEGQEVWFRLADALPRWHAVSRAVRLTGLGGGRP